MNSIELKALRVRLGWSQQKFGVQLGFAPTSARMRISEIENGRRGVSSKTARICELLEKRSKGRRAA